MDGVGMVVPCDFSGGDLRLSRRDRALRTVSTRGSGEEAAMRALAYAKLT